MHVFFGEFLWRLLKSFVPDLEFITTNEQDQVITAGAFFMDVINIDILSFFLNGQFYLDSCSRFSRLSWFLGHNLRKQVEIICTLELMLYFCCIHVYLGSVKRDSIFFYIL